MKNDRGSGGGPSPGHFFDCIEVGGGQSGLANFRDNRPEGGPELLFRWRQVPLEGLPDRGDRLDEVVFGGHGDSEEGGNVTDSHVNEYRRSNRQCQSGASVCRRNRSRSVSVLRYERARRKTSCPGGCSSTISTCRHGRTDARRSRIRRDHGRNADRSARSNAIQTRRQQTRREHEHGRGHQHKRLPGCPRRHGGGNDAASQRDGLPWLRLLPRKQEEALK